MLKRSANRINEVAKIMVSDEDFALTYQVEWLLCYVKVLSREQIANYYDCRQAILGIMSDIFEMLRSKERATNFSSKLNEEDDNWAAITEMILMLYERETQLSAYLQYQLNIILLHRLSDLQANNVVILDEICESMKKYDKLVQLFLSDAAEQKNVPMLVLPPCHKAVMRQLK
jgi:hypothetical protein